MSNFSITLTSRNQSNTSDFITYFPNPIELRGLQYQIGLTRFDSSYSWYNISAEIGNNIFKYNNGEDDKVLTIPDGCYSFINLVNQIHDLMEEETDFTPVLGQPVFDINFELDLADSHTNMILTNGYTVDFTGTAEGIATVFGFDPLVYNADTLSQNKTDITNGVSYIYVHLDIISGSSYIDGYATDVIASFAVNAQENEVFTVIPETTRFLPINSRHQINNIRMYLTDDKFRPINLQGFPIKAEFMAVPILNI